MPARKKNTSRSRKKAKGSILKHLPATAAFFLMVLCVATATVFSRSLSESVMVMVLTCVACVMALLPRSWMERPNVLSLISVLVVLIVAFLSGMFRMAPPLSLTINRYVFIGTAVVTFFSYLSVVMRKASEERRPDSRQLRWWLWYPTISIMLFAGVAFFEFQRHGGIEGVFRGLELGAIPFSAMIFAGMYVRILSSQRPIGRRLVLAIVNGLLLVGGGGGILWYFIMERTNHAIL